MDGILGGKILFYSPGLPMKSSLGVGGIMSQSVSEGKLHNHSNRSV